MKNKWLLFLILFTVISLGFFIYFYIKNTDQNHYDEYTSDRISVTQVNNYTESNYTENNSNETNSVEVVDNSTSNPTPTEEDLTSFSTKIYTKESARQNNVGLTCSKLNGIVVNNGSSFSFCSTVGPATSDKGYQKADVFDSNGNKKKGLGGGNCQVSTTLYNAVLQVPGLVITERHAHSNKVPYIQSGKDAAVAFGSYDLKFRNDSGFNIKIKAENTPDSVTITISKML